ncbi:hypothetical protein CMI37_28640 [Candidatus Pacearchaeota archaeon]|nr:hypothetical protein [Candidatus Pacearchaeota archaeon]|tara:strand:+ start:900 stop:1931 length:1032 start_codon:yes stop_codon:yes gene_type:complete
MNDVSFYDKLAPLFDRTQRRGQENSKEVVLRVNCSGLGDTLCCTPTLRKLAKAYAKKIIVCSFHYDVFKHNPFVKNHISHDELAEDNQQYEIFDTYKFLRKNEKNDIWNTARFDLRRIHASEIGLDLLPEEMQCDYYPGPVEFDKEDLQFIKNNKYIAIHVAKTWPSRTWPKEEYKKLIKGLNEVGHPVVLIGLDLPPEPGTYKTDKTCYDTRDWDFEGLNFINKNSLDESYCIIKNSEAFITLDSGALHLAGCTDTHIINIGSSINPRFRIPYRHSSQDYKVTFVAGSCDLFCASDPKYSVVEHGSLSSVPPVPFCLEEKPTFECQPNAEKVINATLETLGT